MMTVSRSSFAVVLCAPTQSASVHTRRNVVSNLVDNGELSIRMLLNRRTHSSSQVCYVAIPSNERMNELGSSCTIASRTIAARACCTSRYNSDPFTTPSARFLSTASRSIRTRCLSCINCNTSFSRSCFNVGILPPSPLDGRRARHCRIVLLNPAGIAAGLLSSGIESRAT